MPQIIGVTGGSGSGKTTFSQKLLTILQDSQQRVCMISSDWFYRTRPTNMPDYNYDNPVAFDFTTLIQALETNTATLLPTYDYVNHCQIPPHVRFDPTQWEVVIIEGIMLYNHEALRNLINLRLFVYTDLDVCLARRILRDMKERGRSVDSVISQWFHHVKPGYDEYIFPTMTHADYIFNNTKDSLDANLHNDDRFSKVIQAILGGNPHSPWGETPHSPPGGKPPIAPLHSVTPHSPPHSVTPHSPLYSVTPIAPSIQLPHGSPLSITPLYPVTPIAPSIQLPP